MTPTTTWLAGCTKPWNCLLFLSEQRMFNSTSCGETKLTLRRSEEVLETYNNCTKKRYRILPPWKFSGMASPKVSQVVSKKPHWWRGYTLVESIQMETPIVPATQAKKNPFHQFSQRWIRSKLVMFPKKLDNSTSTNKKKISKVS